MLAGGTLMQPDKGFKRGRADETELLQRVDLLAAQELSRLATIWTSAPHVRGNAFAIYRRATQSPRIDLRGLTSIRSRFDRGPIRGRLPAHASDK